MLRHCALASCSCPWCAFSYALPCTYRHVQAHLLVCAVLGIASLIWLWSAYPFFQNKSARCLVTLRHVLTDDITGVGAAVMVLFTARLHNQVCTLQTAVYLITDGLRKLGMPVEAKNVTEISISVNLLE